MTIQDIRPNPEEVWGLEKLNPKELFEWVRTRWCCIARAPEAKPVLLSYRSHAEPAALRKLQTFARFGRESRMQVTYLTPTQDPMIPLPPEQPETRHLFLVHRLSRFLNVREWLIWQQRYPGSILIATCAVDELPALRERSSFDEQRIPEVDAAIARRRAREILAKYLCRKQKRDADFSSFFNMLAQAGAAGVQTPLRLVMRALEISEQDLMKFLSRPEICDFIYLSGRGPIPQRLACFRGAWLAEATTDKAKIEGYPLLQRLLPHVAPECEAEAQFFLDFLIALQAQGLNKALLRLKREYRAQMMACKEQSDEKGRLAWFSFLHHPLLSTVRFFFFVKEQKLRRLLNWNSGKWA